MFAIYYFTQFSAFAVTAALFEQCNHVVELEAGQKIFINSPYYPLQYPIGSSCRYTVKAPQDYELFFKCTIRLNAPSTNTRCQNEIFYFNREGSELLSDSEYFCGSGSVERQSFLNRAVISYISTLPTTTRAKATVPNNRNVATAKTKLATAGYVTATVDILKYSVANAFYVKNNKNNKNNNYKGNYSNERHEDGSEINSNNNNNNNSINYDHVHRSNNNKFNSNNSDNNNNLQQDINNNNNNNNNNNIAIDNANVHKSNNNKFKSNNSDNNNNLQQDINNNNNNNNSNDNIKHKDKNNNLYNVKDNKNFNKVHSNNDENHNNNNNNYNNNNNAHNYYTLPLNTINTIAHIPNTTANTAVSPAPGAVYVTPKPDADVSGALAYVVTRMPHLLPNTISSSVFLAPTTAKRRKPTTVAPTTSSTSMSDAVLAVLWRNGSSAATLTSSATLTSFPTSAALASPAGKRSKKPSTLRRPKIVTGIGDYGLGGGSFSCLVEAVQPQCDCGWNTAVKVAGPASVAAINEFPSMAGVLTVKNNKIFCGAAIIHHRYLLSAAHCFITPSTNRSELIRVVVGEHDLSTVLESVYTRYHDIEAILLHEHFRTSSVTVRNDIALLRTRLPIEWNRAVGPACLPLRSDGGHKPPVAGQRVDTAGWGTISFGGPQSMRLLKTTLDVITTEQCKRSVRSVPPATFCTYTPGRDTCQYDSGGALYVRDERLFAVGIVSYGFACAAQQPSVNTKVASFIRWIKSKTPEVRYCVK